MKKKISQKAPSRELSAHSKTQFYFATGIYHSSLLKKVQLKPFLNELENDVFQLSQSDHKGVEWSAQNYVNGYTSYSSLDRLDLMTDSFLKLRKKIDGHVQTFLTELNYDCDIKDLMMTQCWVNVMFENAVHASHIHPHSVISGTFYVRVPESSSPIKFEDPRLGYFMNSPQVHSKAPESFQRFIKFHNKPGDLVLFESWLRHEVPVMTRHEVPVRQQTKKSSAKTSKKSKDSEPRISISFNYGKK